MLTPVPPAPRLVKTWDEALALVRERSTDLRSAEAGVERAEWPLAPGAGAAAAQRARRRRGVAHDLLNPDAPLGREPRRPLATAARATTPVGTLTATLTQSLVDLSAWRGLSSARASELSADGEPPGRAPPPDAGAGPDAGGHGGRRARRGNQPRGPAPRPGARGAHPAQLRAGRGQPAGRGAREPGRGGGARRRSSPETSSCAQAREALGLALGFDQAVGVRPGASTSRAWWTSTPQSLRALDGLDSAAGPGGGAGAAWSPPSESRRQASAGYLPTLGVSSTLYGLTTEPGLRPLRHLECRRRAVRAPLGGRRPRGGWCASARASRRRRPQALESTRRDVELEVAQARRGVEVAEAPGEDGDRVARRSRSGPTSSPGVPSRWAAAAASSWCRARRPCARRSSTLVLREFELVQARLDAFLTEARCDW